MAEPLTAAEVAPPYAPLVPPAGGAVVSTRAATCRRG
jgi:hypothetical protein